MAKRKIYRKPTIPAEIRFWNKVNKYGPIPSFNPALGECWIWTAGQSHGYGNFVVEHHRPKKAVHEFAHRYAYRTSVKTIPDKLQIDHLCRVPLCVRPSHLEPVTNRTNVLRGFSPLANKARQTHCIYGHALAEDNVYRDKNGRGRHCKICVIGRVGATRLGITYAEYRERFL